MRRQALVIGPDVAEVRANLALALLSKGDYEQGWSESTWRWRTGKLSRPALMAKRPAWDPAGPPGGLANRCC